MPVYVKPASMFAAGLLGITKYTLIEQLVYVSNDDFKASHWVVRTVAAQWRSLIFTVTITTSNKHFRLLLCVAAVDVPSFCVWVVVTCPATFVCCCCWWMSGLTTPKLLPTALLYIICTNHNWCHQCSMNHFNPFGRHLHPVHLMYRPTAKLKIWTIAMYVSIHIIMYGRAGSYGCMRVHQLYKIS